MNLETLEKANALQQQIDDLKIALSQFNTSDETMIAILNSSNLKSARYFLTPGINDGDTSPIATDMIDETDFKTIKRLIRAAIEKRLNNLQTQFDHL